ncbi:Tc toxin subunit A-related protein [Nocardia heshunensis]
MAGDTVNDAYQVLAAGSSGLAVRDLHARLLDLDAPPALDELAEGFFGPSTRYQVVVAQRLLQLPGTGVVDADTADALARAQAPRRGYVVGRALGPDGDAAEGISVLVCDREMRAMRTLARTHTDERGYFLARYDRPTGDDGVNIAVRAMDRDRGQLFETPMTDTVFDAGPLVSLEIHLPVRVAPEFSDYERFTGTLESALAGRDWSDLAEDSDHHDIAFLAGRTGLPAGQITDVVLAHRIASRGVLPAAFVYALLAGDALAAPEYWATLTPRLWRSVASSDEALFADIALLPDDKITDAVTRAIAAYVVPSTLAEELPDVVHALAEHRGAAREFADAERRRVLVVATGHLLSPDVLARLSELAGGNGYGDLPGVLDRLVAAGAVPQGPAAEDARTALAVTELFGDDATLTASIRARHGLTGGDQLHRLAALDEADWSETIAAHAAAHGVALDEDTVRLRAAGAAARAAAKYPTAAFAARLARDVKPPVRQADTVAAILAAHPEFDLAAGNVAALLEGHPDPIPHPADTAAALRTAQRLYRLAPSYAQVTALSGMGIGSASEIVARGRGQFARNAVRSGAFTPATAAATFAAATDLHAAAAIMAGQLHGAATANLLPALGGVATAVAAKLEPVVSSFPNMKSLFQGIDSAECPDCRSVHGPAAYLVDALQFLRHRRVVDTTATPPAAGIGALDVLLARRPDLAVTDLNCDNAEIPLPYLDLVCELLEDAVALDPGIAFAGPVTAGAVSPSLRAALTAGGLDCTGQAIVYGPSDGEYVLRDARLVVGIRPVPSGWTLTELRQTFGTESELAAAPRYVNRAAYQVVAADVSCFALPFDLADQETRQYFAQFGVERAELMSLLVTSAGPSPAQIAAQRFGLTDAQRALIVTPALGDQQRIWTTPAAPAAATLSNVAAFVTRANISFPDLLELLTLAWIAAGTELFVQSLDASADLAAKRIVNLDDAALDRLHRFLRLRAATGWSNSVLDRAIRSAAGGAGLLDDNCLATLAVLREAADLLGLTVVATLDLLEPLHLDDPAGVYAATFRDPVTVGVLDPRFAPDAVRANETLEMTTPGSGTRLSAVRDYLRLALGLEQIDTAALIAIIGVDPPLTTHTLSAAYAISRTAKALGLSISQIADLIALTGTPIFDGAPSAAALQSFARTASALRGSALTIQTWRYLLRHDNADLAARDMAPAAVTALLSNLHSEYDAARATDAAPYSPSSSVAENIAAMMPFLATLPGSAQHTLTALRTLMSDSWADPATTESAFVDTVFGPYADTSGIKVALAARAGTPATDTAARNAVIGAIGDAVSAYRYRLDRSRTLVTALAAALALGEGVTVALLGAARLKEPAALGGPILFDVLLDDSTTAATADAQHRAVELLHVLAGLFSSLALPASAVSWLLANAEALGWPQPDRLPYRAGQPPWDPAAWRTFLGYLDLRAAYPDIVNPAEPARPISVEFCFDAVRAAAPTADLLQALAALTGSGVTALTALDSLLGLSTPSTKGYADPATVRRLLDAAAMLRTLGLDAAAAARLTRPVLDADDAPTLRRSLKCRYSERDWLGVLKQLQDPLRERKRDALVAYLLAHNPDITSSAELYEYFLIDTDMTALMTTSRIVTAHAAVQLFAMRCLMGLEPTAVAAVGDDDGWKQWDWMANFRVWEANRKIFLWPENWLSPDLRDDKSELFVDLENTLRQDQLTDIAVEDAAARYLEGLDDLAFLEVMSVYYDQKARTTHIFARTRGGSPAVYYHRELHHERAWTPWAKVPLDITGDALLAFSRNDRLTLAWPEFTSEPDTDKQPPGIPDPAGLTGGKPNDRPDHRWRIQLAVSENAGGRWREKKVSRGALLTQFTQYPPDSAGFNFFEWGFGADQAVSCFLPSGGYLGSFALTGCKGYPEPSADGAIDARIYPRFVNTDRDSGRFDEQAASVGGELTIEPLPGLRRQILAATPAGRFTVAYPMQLTTIDWILLLVEAGSHGGFGGGRTVELALPLGTLLPYVYGDYQRDYILVPGWYPGAHYGERALPAMSGADKTAADIFEFLDKAGPFIIKWAMYRLQNPDMPLAAFLDAVTQDPDYPPVRAALAEFAGLRYGIRIHNLYHPLVCALRIALDSGGVPALMARELQLTDTGFDFEAVYKPTPDVVQPYPRENVDFELDGAYSSYNWELFFHLPLTVARQLNQDQRFAAARDWLHYIFNPVGTADAAVPDRYWQTKPFYQRRAQDYLSQRIDRILGDLGQNPPGELAFAIAEWRSDPLRPDVVARSRTVAYQMAVVIDYVQNLIDWGDSLFRQFTRESVNQATQLYVLADKLLGPKPRVVAPMVPVPDMNYRQLRSRLDIFGNALIDLENLVPDVRTLPHKGAELPPPPTTFGMLYFCIPPNAVLLAKWDLVADRLFKIRHCQNIDGVAASLALFSPPIDPGALVRAMAAGADVSSIVAGLGAPPPHYRFTVMVAKAAELTQHVAGLGVELLAALEKRDGEAMARLRQGHEIAVLDSTRDVKLATIAEASGAVIALTKSKDVINERINYYSGQDYMNTWETVSVALNGASLLGEAAVALGCILAGGLTLMPQFMVGAAGFGGSPLVTTTIGGEQAGGASGYASQVLAALTRVADKSAAMAGSQGGYQRRQDEWNHQLALARAELAQLEVQIDNADLHVATLTKDLATHDLQTRNAKALAEFMSGKYTNAELYTWMIAQVTRVYFDAYRLAFDVAKKAERCYNYELGVDSDFIQFGYWDSTKKGLLAAEPMLHAIKRMEIAYLDNNIREYELTKHVSLAQLDPGALLRLKATGKATIQVPEVVFDLDHPSHYMRRIKTVGTSLLCNAGPYTTVGMTLSLVDSRYRTAAAARPGATTDKDKYAEDPGNDPRFAYHVASMSSIATSTAVSDSGLFELNFHDDRYLPFEGAGAISTWQLELPTAYPQFDHDTISDLILHIRYTAREGGSAFRTMVEKATAAVINETLTAEGEKGLHIAFSLRESFPTEWWQLTDTGSTTLTLGLEHLPFFARDHAPTLTALSCAASVDGAPAGFAITIDGTSRTLNRDPAMPTLCTGSAGTPSLGTPISLSCDPAKLRDLVLLVTYSLT